jgi:putative transcriptional regulator
MTMAKVKSPAARTVARQIASSLEQLDAALAAGGMAEVERQFTVRRVAVPQAKLAACDVAAVRKRIGASQAVFAALLGVSANAVRAWEQGVNPLPGIARQFIAEIRDNADYWRAKVAASANAN